MTIHIQGHPRFVRNYRSLSSELQNRVDSVLTSLKTGDKGDYIKKRPYPKRYVKDGVENLYRYPISSHRLIYTITGIDYVKVYTILDFLTHKEYDNIFGYQTS